MGRRLEDLLATNYSDDNGYSINVLCHGSCHLGAHVDKSTPDHDGSIPIPILPVEFKASVLVQHRSVLNLTRRKIIGYYTFKKFTLQSCQVFSRGCCRGKVKKILDMINPPFSLDEKEFQWKGVNDYRTDHQSCPNREELCIHDSRTDHQSCSSSKSLKNSEELVSELVEFFQRIKDSEVQPLCSVDKISVRLNITRSVFLPPDLFRDWIYWSRNRIEEYIHLVGCRPAIEMQWRIAAVMTLDSLRVDGGLSSDICSICMNELSSPEEEVIRMVCSHSFHHSCILKWLKVKESCPCCRASFTMIEPATYAPQF